MQFVRPEYINVMGGTDTDGDFYTELNRGY